MTLARKQAFVGQEEEEIYIPIFQDKKVTTVCRKTLQLCTVMLYILFIDI